MNTFPYDMYRADAPNKAEIALLYYDLLAAWNAQNASSFASFFGDTGLVIGFDGSLMDTPREISDTLKAIFADHPTATYVAKVRDVRFLSPTTVLLHAVVGMVPRGGSDINP